MLDALTTMLEAAATAPWVPAVVLLVALGDALLPPIPSEGLVVALAAAAAAGAGPHPVLLALAAGTGAFLGDGATFLVGRRYGPGRLARVTRPSARRVLARAESTLAERGALVVLTARYVPLGRVAVNLTAGATGFAPRRFVGLAALAAATWAAWSVAIGSLAGSFLDGSPLLGSALGIALALALGVVVDRAARRATGRSGRPAPSDQPAGRIVGRSGSAAPADQPARPAGEPAMTLAATIPGPPVVRRGPQAFALSPRECQ